MSKFDESCPKMDVPLNLHFQYKEKDTSHKQNSLRRILFTFDDNIPPLECNEYDWIDIQSSNRMLEKYSFDSFILIDFNIKITSKRVANILTTGINLDGIEFSFIGGSSTGIKERTYYFMRGTKSIVSDILRECGDFDKLKSISKRVARISLLFSGSLFFYVLSLSSLRFTLLHFIHFFCILFRMLIDSPPFDCYQNYP